MKHSMIQLRKQTASFFREIFSTPKAFIIVSYILLCFFLYGKFADKGIMSNPLQHLTLATAPIIALHYICILAAVIFYVLLMFALGTCLKARLRIKADLPNAGLTERKEQPQPILNLYIPHRKQKYIEFEFYSPGITRERWEERRKAIESVLDITIIGEIENGEKWSMIAFKARKGKDQPKRGDLYE